MSIYRKFWALSLGEKILLTKVSLLMIAVRISLRWMSFNKLFKIIERSISLHAVPKKTNLEYRDKIIRAVNRSGHFFLGENLCLPQALVTYLLLKRNGQPVQLQIGVKRDSEGEFRAHAWIESNGEVVIGGSGIDLDRYVKLNNLNGAIL